MAAQTLNPNRFFHLADVHLGAPNVPSKVPAQVRATVEHYREEALRDVCQRAKIGGVGTVVIAGDLFHRPIVPIGTRNRVAQMFADADPVQVFIVPGNHDYLTAADGWDTHEWPENVHIADAGKMMPYEPTPHGPRFWAWAWNRPKIPVSPVCAWTMPPRPHGPHDVLVMHGSMLGAQPESWRHYAAFAAANLPLGQVDYVALGHLHWHSVAEPRNGTPIVYPGALAPVDFGDRMPGGFVDAMLSPVGVEYAWRPSTAASFAERTHAIGDVHTAQDLLDLVQGPPADGQDRQILSVTLVGLLHPDLKPHVPNVYDQARKRFLHLTLHDLTIPAPEEGDRPTQSLALADFLERIDGAIERAEEADTLELLRAVREHGLAAAANTRSAHRGTVYQ